MAANQMNPFQKIYRYRVEVTPYAIDMIAIDAPDGQCDRTDVFGNATIEFYIWYQDIEPDDLLHMFVMSRITLWLSDHTYDAPGGMSDN